MIRLTKIVLATTLATVILVGCASDKSNDDTKTTSLSDRRNFERSSDEVIEKKIDDLLSQMTIEEKIGQMTQVNNSQIVSNSQWGAGTDLRIEIKVDSAK